MSPATKRRPPLAALRRALPSVPSLPPVVRRWAVLSLVIAAALAAGWFAWFRDSSFVQVENVRVEGVTGPQASAIRNALTDAAYGMTTLNVREGDLREAVEGFPTISRVEAKADFPHDLVVRVTETPPVASLSVGGRRVPVGPDGSLLRGVRYDRHLPLISAPAPPGVDRLTSGRAHRLLLVLAEAPRLMLRRVRDVRVKGADGIAVRLRTGPELIFGDTTRLRAKWIAATRVLASRSARGATYVDLRLPERPAAGGLAAPTIEPTTPAGTQAAPAPATAAPAPQGNPQPQVETTPQPSTQP